LPDLLTLVLSGVILALFGVTLLFSGYTVVLRARHERRDRLWGRLSALWEEPVLAAIMDPGAIDAARAAVPEEHRLHFVQYVLEYTRRLRGEERRTLRRLVEPYLPLVAERVDHRRAEVRTRAIQTLGTLGLPQYADEVVAGLDDPSPLVSMVAARALARRDVPQYAPQVMKHLHRFEGWNHRFLASMLAAIGPEVSERLRRGLAEERSPAWLRAVHAEALRMQLDPVSGDVAARALRDAEDRELIAACLRLLATVGRPHHLSEVRRFCDAGDPVVRAQALHALGQLGGEREIPMLLDAVGDPTPWVALHAARGVREAGGERLLRELVEADGPYARLAGQVLDEGDQP
jgi:HEAT repeat protein